MKRYKMLLISFLVFSMLWIWQGIYAQVVQDPGVSVSKFHVTWELVVAFITGVYELLVRLIPTYKHWSVIGKILEILLWISQKLSIKKK